MPSAKQNNRTKKVPETKQRGKKTVKAVVVAETPTEQDISEVEEEVVNMEEVVNLEVVSVNHVDVDVEEVAVEVVEKVSRRRAVPTKESVSDEGLALLQLISDEIAHIKDGSRKGTGVQFLNSLSKKLRSYNTNVSRVTRKRQVTKRVSSVNSGFLKPVIVSKEVAEFAGWNQDDLHSRTDVTKVICNYIKENNLQNPENRRLIVPDDKLSKLLSFEESSFEDEIRYCDIQRLLKSHFTNPPK